jgi:hypothetical protein
MCLQVPAWESATKLYWPIDDLDIKILPGQKGGPNLRCVCVCVCVCARARACVRVCVRARARVRACMEGGRGKGGEEGCYRARALFTSHRFLQA